MLHVWFSQIWTCFNLFYNYGYPQTLHLPSLMILRPRKQISPWYCSSVVSRLGAGGHSVFLLTSAWSTLNTFTSQGFCHPGQKAFQQPQKQKNERCSLQTSINRPPSQQCESHKTPRRDMQAWRSSNSHGFPWQSCKRGDLWSLKLFGSVWDVGLFQCFSNVFCRSSWFLGIF